MDEPEANTGFAPLEEHEPALRQAEAASAIPATAERGASVENHQRLSHSITLGALDAAYSAESAAPGAAAPSVSVTINNFSTSSGGPYAGYFAYGMPSGYRGRGGGAVPGQARVTSTSRPGSAATSAQAGQSWPAITDYGSSFPYRSAPASPWSAAGSR